MIRKTFSTPDGSFNWIDVTNPTVEELQDLADEFGIHKTSIQDCLEPYHLPKYERLEKHKFLILRIMEQNADESASSILELTRKIAIFTCVGFLLTIHRKEIPFLTALHAKWEARLKDYPGDPKDHLLLDILSDGFATYDLELEAEGRKLDDLELAVFELVAEPYDLHSLYRLKRRASLCKRLLRLSVEVVARFASDVEPSSQVFARDLKEDVDNTLFYADDLLESLNQLLSTHYGLETQKANEVMKVLAIFSAFFFPLTLIAGIYGMNFKFMPELEWKHGYAYSLGLMALTSIGIYIWFRKKKWL